jgi:hypothetical protein
MNQELCLFCLEDINFTEILTKPSHCNCKVVLHQNCMQLIENTGLLCPICRIKKSQNIIINTENDNSFLLLFANNTFNYFAAKPTTFRFIVFFVGSLIVTIGLIPKLVWVGLDDQTYRFQTLIFLGIISVIFFEILKNIFSLY